MSFWLQNATKLPPLSASSQYLLSNYLLFQAISGSVLYNCVKTTDTSNCRRMAIHVQCSAQENGQLRINMTLPISEKYSDLFDERAGLLIGALKALCVMEH